MMSIAEQQADFVQALRFDDIPQEVVHRANLCVKEESK